MTGLLNRAPARTPPARVVNRPNREAVGRAATRNVTARKGRSVTVATPEAITVYVTRWKTSGWPWWHRGGLALDIDWPNTENWCTQTYRTRNLDKAREMILDYMHCQNIDIPENITIKWIENGNKKF